MRADRVVQVAGTGAVAFAFYWRTAARGLSWENFGADGGELITAAVTLGVPHPPGYPIYVLLGKLASLAPFGGLAFRLNLFSALGIAAASGFVADLSHQILKSQPYDKSSFSFPAAAAALTFAFSSLVWGQATITEVYGLNLALLGAFLWSLLSSRSPWTVGLLLGLSVTTHLTSILMLPMALAFTRKADWPRLILATIVGLTPFALLPLLARSGSPVIWGDPQNLDGWWRLISGRIYAPNVMAVRGEMLVERLGEWTPLLLKQFTLAGPLLLAMALYRWYKSLGWQGFALLGSAALYLIYAFGYSSNDAIVFTTPAFLLLAIAVAPGLQALGRWSLLLPVLLVLINFSENDLSHEIGVRQAAAALLDSAPPHALLLTPGDATVFALWYFHHVEHMRPDLILVDENLFAFDWYRQRLGDRYPQLKALAQDDLARFEKMNSGRAAVCHVKILNASEFSNTCLETAPL